MSSDIVFDQVGGDSITLQAAHVVVTGRLRLQRTDGGRPSGDGEIGDLVMTIEEGENPVLHVTFSTTRLWLCVPPEGEVVGGRTWWREVQLGPAVSG